MTERYNIKWAEKEQANTSVVLNAERYFIPLKVI